MNIYRILLLLSLLLINQLSGAATIETVANGYWSRAETWSASRVPGASDTIIIRHQVMLDRDITVGAALLVKAGAKISQQISDFQITVDSGAVLHNYGSITCRDIQVAGKLYNHAYQENSCLLEAVKSMKLLPTATVINEGWIRAYELTTDGGSELTNKKAAGGMEVKANFFNYGEIANDGDITILGDVENHGSITGSGGNYYCEMAFRHYPGASLGANGDPINICSSEGDFPEIIGAGKVSFATVHFCGGGATAFSPFR